MIRLFEAMAEVADANLTTPIGIPSAPIKLLFSSGALVLREDNGSEEQRRRGGGGGGKKRMIAEIKEETKRKSR